jgi:MOSC domain-containing protein YiiM
VRPHLRSVNIGLLVDDGAIGEKTAIYKYPVTGAVFVSAPGRAKGLSGLAGDSIGDIENHGGDDQAVYAFAREDLDLWEAELGRLLPDGSFGENFTLVGLDPNRALIGERWQVGSDLVVQVTSPRIPCRAFARRMAEEGWARRFTERGRPGAYLRVLQAGQVEAGDPVTVLHKPGHKVDVTTALWALTIKPWLLVSLLEAGGDLPGEMRQAAEAAAQPSLARNAEAPKISE